MLLEEWFSWSQWAWSKKRTTPYFYCLFFEYVQMVHCCSFFPFPADPIDVLRVLELSENMEGVSLKAGFCTGRKGTEETDPAYKIDKKIQLSAPTKQLFPGSGLFFSPLDHKQHSILSHEAMKYLMVSEKLQKALTCVCVFCEGFFSE